MLTAVTGINWGDEGKGRVIDLLAGQADVVVRYQGGNNAGHTVVTEQGKFILNLIPSGILHSGVTCVLGDGMVVDLEHLENEIQKLWEKDVAVSPKNLKISTRATQIFHFQTADQMLDRTRKAFDDVKTTTAPTGMGIATAANKLLKYGAQENPKRKVRLPKDNTESLEDKVS